MVSPYKYKILYRFKEGAKKGTKTTTGILVEVGCTNASECQIHLPKW